MRSLEFDLDYSMNGDPCKDPFAMKAFFWQLYSWQKIFNSNWVFHFILINRHKFCHYLSQQKIKCLKIIQAKIIIRKLEIKSKNKSICRLKNYI